VLAGRLHSIASGGIAHSPIARVHAFGDAIPSEVVECPLASSPTYGFSGSIVLEQLEKRPRQCRGTKTPVSPSLTVSTTAPERVATTGVPAAMASTGGMPKPSSQTEGKAKMYQIALGAE
jgi:hypothetical protein